jgi:hypothetical protein
VRLLEVVVGEVGVSIEGVEDVVEVAPSAGVGPVVGLWGVLFSVEVVELLIGWVVLSGDWVVVVGDVVVLCVVEGLWLVVGVLVLVFVGDSV